MNLKERTKLFNTEIHFPTITFKIKDIFKGMSTPMIEEECELFPRSENFTKSFRKIPVDNATNIIYNTKKEIKEAIKKYNDNIEHLMVQKRAAPNTITEGFIEAIIEERVQRRDQLLKRVKYTGVKFENNDLKQAKQIPIDTYIQFKGGFANCLWHTEIHGSMKWYQDKNHVYCFSCQKKADCIDVVMSLNNCDLPKAIKIILNK